MPDDAPAAQWRKVTEREIAFVDNFRLNGNITQAYLDAGYKVGRDVARSAGSRLMKSPKILRLLAIPTRAKEMTIERIQEELARDAFGEPTDKLTRKDKLRALELLGKSKGAFAREEKSRGLTTIQILNITNKVREKDSAPQATKNAAIDVTPEALGEGDQQSPEEAERTLQEEKTAPGSAIPQQSSAT